MWKQVQWNINFICTKVTEAPKQSKHIVSDEAALLCFVLWQQPISISKAYYCYTITKPITLSWRWQSDGLLAACDHETSPLTGWSIFPGLYIFNYTDWMNLCIKLSMNKWHLNCLVIYRSVFAAGCVVMYPPAHHGRKISSQRCLSCKKTKDR